MGELAHQDGIMIGSSHQEHRGCYFLNFIVLATRSKRCEGGTYQQMFQLELLSAVSGSLSSKDL